MTDNLSPASSADRKLFSAAELPHVARTVRKILDGLKDYYAEHQSEPSACFAEFYIVRIEPTVLLLEDTIGGPDAEAKAHPVLIALSRLIGFPLPWPRDEVLLTIIRNGRDRQETIERLYRNYWSDREAAAHLLTEAAERLRQAGDLEERVERVQQAINDKKGLELLRKYNHRFRQAPLGVWHTDDMIPCGEQWVFLTDGTGEVFRASGLGGRGQSIAWKERADFEIEVDTESSAREGGHSSGSGWWRVLRYRFEARGSRVVLVDNSSEDDDDWLPIDGPLNRLSED